MWPDFAFTVSKRLVGSGVGVFAVLLALVAAGAAPAALRAETLSFQNNTNVPLLIQGSYVVRGMVRRDQPIQVQPGGVAKISLPGNKVITVYDAKLPNRVLYQDTINSSSDDQTYTLQTGKSGKITAEPVKGPAMPR